MERKLKNHAVVGICALGLIGLNSCLKVDETYDLDKDFDMTITVGGDLTVPGSSTEEIKLGDLLDLEDNEVIRVNNESGDYFLVQEGDRNFTDVKVPGVDINMLGSFTGVKIKDKYVPPFSSGSNNETKITFNDDIDINVFRDGVTSDIKDITGANTYCKDTYLMFTKTGVEFNARLDEGYTLEFPDYIELESNEKDWKVEGNKMTLNKVGGLEIDEDTRIYFQITGVNFKDENGNKVNDAKFKYNDNDNSSITLGGVVKLDGGIFVSAEGSTGGYINLGANIHSENMIFRSVTAVVDPKVDIEIDPIRIDDLPDFLSDNNVVLDLTDPRIYITLTNPSPVSVDVNATLKSYKNNISQGTAALKNINIPKNCENYEICINQNQSGWDEESEVMFVQIAQLSDLIKNIPDRIELTDVETSVVSEEVTIDLGINYTIITDYKVDTPLQFGAETEIIYTENMDGWDADLEDMQFNSVEASMIITNAIPLGINLTGEAIVIDNNEAIVIDNNNDEEKPKIDVELNANIPAGSPESPVKQEVKFTITSQDGSIKGLDGIKLTVKASASENTSTETLNENQYMQFENIKLGLKGGITMDLN
ncbi:hypothetical protein [uncultured Bacteroides sp.]|uniref:hypothetical protein n=1 Tax=uncultured Bacteroides sp. TaxID=162156 RepID=UPI002593A76D|nr:hypothetical protein [uncultured Bacteroides sp.]